MSEVWHLRGEGGSVFAMGLPLAGPIAQRLAAGAIVRVNKDGSDWIETAEAPAVEPKADPSLGSLDRPARADSVAEWRAYAKQVSDLPAADLEALTKADLIKQFG